jgi:hypothetical protein
MDSPESHLAYDELDTPHSMACDCECACDNLHLEKGTEDHASHLAECDRVVTFCEVHVPDSAARLAGSLHTYLD